nr:uncharacterized protein LOC101249978 isoform X2 [Solanum lycopersicum]
MREENGTIEKGSSCRVDGNCKRVNPINETGAGGTGSGEGVSSSPASSSLSSKNQGKSCKGCLYYSSTFKSNSRNPLCIGLSSSLPQVPRYIVGESEKEASKEGRSFTDFRYACVGYSVYLDQKSRSTEAQKAQTELPVCVGLEVLVDKRPTSADATPGHTPAHNREVIEKKVEINLHSPDQTNQLTQLVMSSLPGSPGMLTWLRWGSPRTCGK